tara:strand:- start:171 stop:386 length:216 start_codon:yes stop_codon:yes gene_type:complete
MCLILSIYKPREEQRIREAYLKVYLNPQINRDSNWEPFYLHEPFYIQGKEGWLGDIVRVIELFEEIAGTNK